MNCIRQRKGIPLANEEALNLQTGIAAFINYQFYFLSQVAFSTGDNSLAIV